MALIAEVVEEAKFGISLEEDLQHLHYLLCIIFHLLDIVLNFSRHCRRKEMRMCLDSLT